jgi:hypothetical protein
MSSGLGDGQTVPYRRKEILQPRRVCTMQGRRAAGNSREQQGTAVET